MDDKQHNHDGIENLMVELDEAQRAGVFETTRVDVDQLLAPQSKPASTGVLPFRRFMPAAVAAAVVIGVSTWMFQHAPPKGDKPLVQPSGDQFAFCMKGPGRLTEQCLVHDYDQDGDVDLVDYGLLQLRRQ